MKNKELPVATDKIGLFKMEYENEISSIGELRNDLTEIKYVQDYITNTFDAITKRIDNLERLYDFLRDETKALNKKVKIDGG